MADFQVSFQNRDIENMQHLSMKNTEKKPTLSWHSTPGTLYTVEIWDSTADYFHLFAVNICGKQKEILSYERPNPPSGTHEYHVFLYKQKKPFTEFPELKRRSREGISPYMTSGNLQILANITFFVSHEE